MQVSTDMQPKCGRLQAILSAGVLFREDSFTKAFKTRVAVLRGEIQPLPDDSFRILATRFRTAHLQIDLRGKKTDNRKETLIYEPDLVA